MRPATIFTLLALLVMLGVAGVIFFIQLLQAT